MTSVADVSAEVRCSWKCLSCGAAGCASRGFGEAFAQIVNGYYMPIDSYNQDWNTTVAVVHQNTLQFVPVSSLLLLFKSFFYFHIPFPLLCYYCISCAINNNNEYKRINPQHVADIDQGVALQVYQSPPKRLQACLFTLRRPQKRVSALQETQHHSQCQLTVVI